MAGADARASTGLWGVPRSRSGSSSFRGARALYAGEPGIQQSCITSGFRVRAKSAPRNDGQMHWLQRAPEIMRDFADHATAEGQHADHENRALDHRDPLPISGEILLHGDDDEGADHRTEYGAETANQRHQHDFTGHGPVHVGQRSVLRDEYL